MEDERKIIYITATSGPRLTICGYCRKATGNTTVIISTPFYDVIDTDDANIPEMLSIRFKPVDQCRCLENMLKGARVDCT